MINEIEAKKLVKLVAARDKRTIGDADVDLWLIMSEAGGWTYQQAVRAFIEHSNTRPGQFFEPGHIAERVAEVRREISTRWYCPDPPRELADDVKAEIAWRRKAQQRFMDHNLALWASGQPLQDVSEALALENEKRGELPAASAYDSPAKRAALEEIRKFAKRTTMPKPLESDGQSEEERQRVRAELNRRKWAAVDACSSCDHEGMIIGTAVVCDHSMAKESAA